MPNYQNGKIYSIRSHQTDEIYIGSTAQPKLSLRMGDHRKNYKGYLKGKKNYVSSFEILQYEDAYIELIEFYSCNSKMELEREEGKYQRQMKCVNKYIAGRTDKEWREDNKQVLAEKAKEYRNENKQVLKEKAKEYREENKEIIKEKKQEYHQKNRAVILAKAKEYRKENKEIIKEKKQEHYQKNRAVILAKNNVKTECCCGGSYTRTHKQRHLKTDKHLKYINNI